MYEHQYSEHDLFIKIRTKKICKQKKPKQKREIHFLQKEIFIVPYIFEKRSDIRFRFPYDRKTHPNVEL